MRRVCAFFMAGILSMGLFTATPAQENGDTPDEENTAAPAEENGGNLPKGINLSGFGYYMFGQIVKGTYGDDFTAGSSFSHLWVNTSLIHLALTSNVSDWFTTKLALEMYADFPLKGSSAMDKSSYFRSYKAYLASAEGIMHWDYAGLLNSIKVESGLFPYTFNPQVKSLGNYMYRSTIHPLSVQTKVDYPWADLLGACAQFGLLENRIKFDAMLSSEFIYVPFFDFTPAFALTYAPNKIIDIGAAVAFHHLLQADGPYLADSIGKKWQGTKLDARVILDPKELLGGVDWLGKEDGKIYAELAVLGMNDTLEVDTTDSKGTFPEPSILHRIPLMIGFNVPTFKLLDCFSVELEWFTSPYANDWFGLFDNQKPRARKPTSDEQWDTYINKDNFKWMVTIAKSFGKFEVRSFIGSDHTVYRLSNLSTGNFEQTMKREGDWQWMLELRYHL